MRGSVQYVNGTAVPNVMVSDGHQVTRTAGDGTFSIDPSGAFVFLTRPAGYTAAPWFAPASAERVTFTLRRQEEVFPYRFVHVSDLHLSVDNGARFYPPGVEMGIESVLASFLAGLPDRAADVQSVIATGDLTDLGLDDEYVQLKAALAASPLPVHVLPGNHDHIAGVLPLAGTGIEWVTTRTGYLTHGADPAGYERHLGPRWYAFDLPGLHVVALDWHTHEVGLDNAVQDAWLRADLETVGTGVPWILLSHDQPWTSILDGLPSQPVATFSGHRHTSRVVRVGKTLHVNTPTPMFAGLDYSPPSYRIVRWDGEKIGLETRAVAPTGLERATFSIPSRAVAGIVTGRPTYVRWRHQLAGAGHRSPVRVHGDRVIAPVKREDEASGAVEVLSLADGSLRWRAESRASVKGTPAVYGDVVVAVEVSGDTVGLDAQTGAERWRVPSPDPLRLFAWADPVIARDTVIVGDLAHVRALDPTTGALRWERVGLSAYQTLVAQSNPVLAGDVLILGNFPAPVGMAGLDVATGETVWRLGGRSKDILGGLYPIGTPLYDELSTALYVPTPKGLVAVDTVTGAERWTSTTDLPHNPATPAATPDGIATVFGGDAVVLLDRGDGTQIWRTPARRSPGSELAMASYTRTPQVLFAGPTTVPQGDGSVRLLLPGLDGHVHAFDGASGKPLADVDVGSPIAAPAVVTDDTVLVLSVDGTVSALDRAAFA
ncbi:PQQ-binding-like beta-propeller repeat protein [Candidatus Protofrankia californiensis]|uniref:outer membrane protein assembly factor BamB family protein n=1 Tax=Candidatus Protofrankia californiensis TaxID=1839754 RepID=UPI001041835F|nr:PQQ-binding-like beta-propeller repeat protein [Candidatus Protofrankia californiensis]